MKRLAVAFVSGTLFAVGLAVSGLTQPAKVLGFLDVTGDWDPSLALVMVGAIAVNAVAWVIAGRRASAGVGPGLPPAPRRSLDAPLLTGAAIFGVGWGLSGFCPGTAIASAFAGRGAALVFVPAMLAGMGLYKLVAAGRAAGPDETGAPAPASSACAS